jgi:hypothetical protein
MRCHQVNHTAGNLLLEPASCGFSLRPDLVIRPVTPQSTIAGALAERAAGIRASHDRTLDAHTKAGSSLSFPWCCCRYGCDSATLCGRKSRHPLASIFTVAVRG